MIYTHTNAFYTLILSTLMLPTITLDDYMSSRFKTSDATIIKILSYQRKVQTLIKALLFCIHTHKDLSSMTSLLL